MAKFAIVFFAALAFQAVLATTDKTQEQRSLEVQELLKQVQTISSGASSAIQNVLPEDHQHIHALYSQANEFAHNIHDVVYHLQQVVYQNEEGQSEDLLQQVVSNLAEIVHSVELAIRNEPFELKAQLKTQVQNVAAQAQKLAQVAKHEQSTEQVNDDVEEALEYLLAAIEQLQVRNKIQHKTQEEIKSKLQEVIEQVSNVIVGVQAEDKDTVEGLLHHSHHLAYQVGEIVYKIKREIHNYEGQIETVLEQVSNKLNEVRASLEQVGQTQDKIQVSELKNQLKTNVHNVGVQIEKLVQLIHSETIDKDDVHHLRDLVESVLARSIVAAKQLQREVEYTVQNNQKN